MVSEIEDRTTSSSETISFQTGTLGYTEGLETPPSDNSRMVTERVTTALLSSEVNPANVNVLRLELGELYSRTHSWRKVGMAIGRSAAYAMRVVNGSLQPTSEALKNWYEFRMGKRMVFTDVQVCPIHGTVHKADCHGREVAAVVTLAPGETVVSPSGENVVNRTPDVVNPQPKRPPCFRPRLSLDPQEQLRQLSLLTLRAAARCEVDQARFDAGLPENDEVLSDE